MKIAICYPPLPCEKGVPLLSQNRQFQWFSRPTYIFPVVPATAATMLNRAGHDVAWLDGIAEEWTPGAFMENLDAFAPEVVVLETKTPVVKRHWKWIADYKARVGASVKVVLVGDHVTAMPDETMANCPVDYVLTGGDWDFLLMNLAGSYLDRANALEAQCDSQMDEIVTAMESLIRANGGDMALVDKVVYTYANEKSLKKAWYMSELEQKGLV